MSEGIDPLCFSEEWYSLGIITTKQHQELWVQFQTSIDRNPEHYRWRVFCDFLERKEQRSPDMMRRLYDLGKSDPDTAMGDSMMAKVVGHIDCPDDVLREASQDAMRKHLAKIVQRRS